MRVVKLANKYTLLVCAFLLACNNTTYSREPEHVRVRILEKYYPTKISISRIKDPDTRVILNQNSIFPLTIDNGHLYKIAIPNTNIKRTYAGSILIDKENGYLRIINTVPLEAYVKSVVLSEMGLQYPEAMRTQAILARTWAIKHLQSGKDYDFNDLTDNQVYKGIFTNLTAKSNSLPPTYGQILIYNTQPIEVFYHSDCADRSYSAYEIWGLRQYPYYRRINFPPELQMRQPQHWQRKIAIGEINKIFRKIANTSGPILYTKSTNQGQLGIYINSHWIDIDRFRLLINRKLGWNQLRSNHFSLQKKDGNLIFEGSGFGHLVGLCQKSAVELAKQGWIYSDILQLFYPGTSLARPDTAK